MLVRPARRFPGTLLTWRGSALQETWKPLLGLILASELITWRHEAWGLDQLNLTLTPFTLIGLALSIFLGFRNNACYDRWWEARRLWGGLINTTRTLARQLLVLSHTAEPDPELDAWRERCVRLVIGYAYALKFHLRTRGHWEELRPYVGEALSTALRGEKNPPLALLTALSQEHASAVRRGWVHPTHLLLLEQSVVELCNLQGACERIKNTPVPLTYTVLTHQIVGTYCLLLPLGIVSQVGNMTPLVVGMVAFAFLGLDAVGSQIEDPFETDPNDLPLSAMCRTIEINLLQALGVRDLPPEVRPQNGVLY